MGKDRIEKTINRFLVTNIFYMDLIRKWVANGGESNHNTIFLKLRGGGSKTMVHLEFNLNWFKYKYYIYLVNCFWVPFDPLS